MKNSSRTLAIATGGGDCPGLNAAISAAYRHAKTNLGFNVIGLAEGISGLLSTPPKTEVIETFLHRHLFLEGGTILGANNRGSPLRVEGERKRLLNLAKANWQALGLNGLLVIGGDGTQFMAKSLAEIGLNVVGIPKTIDNDLVGSDTTIGFSTAVEVASDAALRIRSTADAHHRVMVVEVMGRSAGHIALETAVASQADGCLIPEKPFRWDVRLRHIKDTIATRQGGYLLIVAEGAYAMGESPSYIETRAGKKRLSGIGEKVAQTIEAETSFDARACSLGHLLRGGMPNTLDRILAQTLAVQAIDFLSRGEAGFVLMRQGSTTVKRSYTDLTDERRQIPHDHELLLTAHGLGISFAT